MPHKKLKFAAKLIPSILSKDKVSTWRLWDDRALTEGDVLDFLNHDSQELFATARIINISMKPLSALNSEEKRANEPFNSDEEMYTALPRHYQREVGPDTTVKIVWFELLG